MDWTIGWVAAAVAAGVVALAPSQARACGAEEYVVEIVLPPETGDAMPVNAALFAITNEPGIAPVIALRTAEGDEVPIEVDLEALAAGLVQARPVDPLEPGSVYVWDVDGWTRELIAGTEEDLAAPTFGALEVLSSEEIEVGGCEGTEIVREDAIALADPSEPVAIHARYLFEGQWNATIAAYGTGLTLRNGSTEKRCAEIHVVDHGGNDVLVGEYCVAGIEGEIVPADGGSLDDGGSEDDAGDDAAPTDDGAPTGDDGEPEADGGDALDDRGCACTSQPRAPGAWAWLVLAITGVTRRRRGG